MTTRFALLVVVLACGCGSKPSAMDVCGKLKAAGEVSACAPEAPSGLGGAAAEGASGTLPGDKACGVMTFKDEAAFNSTVAAFEAAAMLAGPHRYGNKAKLVFVQCSSGLDAAHGAKVKAVVDAL